MKTWSFSASLPVAVVGGGGAAAAVKAVAFGAVVGGITNCRDWSPAN